MKSLSSIYVKFDDVYNFYYMDIADNDLRFVYLRTLDVANFIGVSKAEVSDKNYLDIWAVCIQITSIASKFDNQSMDRLMAFQSYLHDQFADSSKTILIVPSDLKDADSNWTNLI